MQDYRNQHPDQAISDIYYSDLVSNPIGVVKNLYKELNLEYSAEFEAALQRYISKNPQNKHKYTLQEFGLGKESIRTMFSYYYRNHQSLADAETLPSWFTQARLINKPDKIKKGAAERKHPQSLLITKQACL